MSSEKFSLRDMAAGTLILPGSHNGVMRHEMPSLDRERKEQAIVSPMALARGLSGSSASVANVGAKTEVREVARNTEKVLREQQIISEVGFNKPTHNMSSNTKLQLALARLGVAYNPELADAAGIDLEKDDADITAEVGR